MIRQKCSKCYEDIVRQFKKRTPNSSIKYCDEFGRQWNGRVCPSCHVSGLRKNGSSHQNPLNPVHNKARKAEVLVASKFKQLGVPVIETYGKGPDVIVTIAGVALKCEVKSANYHRGRSLRVCAVKPKRQADDLIAIVLPDGRVMVQSMRQHLALCDKSGSRTVTCL